MSRSVRPEAAPPADLKPGLTLAAAIEPLLSLDDLTVILNVSRRAVERLKSAGKLPRPDLTIGRMPRWRPESIRRWIAEQAEGRGAGR
jgi:predicted DNA-binding transcriptional regulator AlpA